MKKLLLAASAILALLGVEAMEVDLAGTWKLTGTDENGAPIDVPIAVPGGVHTALYKAGKIVDPFWGRNELKTQWVGLHTWTISRTFNVDKETLAKKAIVLRLEDVDLFATITLNGHELGKLDNRFCRWEFDIKPYLKEGENTLTGVFESSELKGFELAKAYAAQKHTFDISNVPWAKNIELTRKPACHGGWDWGLAQMITGFCGTTKILAYDECKIDSVHCDQEFADDYSHCKLTVNVEATDANGKAFTTKRVYEIDKPDLWWPAGAGRQPLFPYEVKVGEQVVKGKIGLRKIEVLTTPDKDENGNPGARMGFKVNGREIFMKGGDWIPCSAWENEQTPARYRDLLESAVQANMNMIRLWGGGQYEKDCFYDICDELGILIWHDFMFSCSIYPGNEFGYLDSVEKELAFQIRRLQDHASIAFWCGDNECVGALKWFPYCTNADPKYYRDALEARYAMCERLIKELDPSRVFWPSSPCAGPGSYADNWINDKEGDMHNWQVWHANKSFDEYYKYRPRFCSEFGYQSFSSRDVAETYCKPEDVNPTSPDFEYHQKNNGGNSRMLETISRYFRFPQSTDAILYLSQIQQSLAMKTGVEGWRAQRPRCMGTIIWQLNDNWPVASWSMLEYGGKWKHVQYQAKRFFAPLAVVGTPGTLDPSKVPETGLREKKTGVVGYSSKVEALNDLAEPVDATVTVEYWTPQGDIVKTDTWKGTLKPDSVTHIGEYPCENGQFLVLTLKTKYGTFTNEWMYDYYKSYDLAKANVNVKVDGFKVTLSTDKPAFFVWANAKGIKGEFDDNSFTLLPGRPKTITFTPKQAVTPEAFKAALSVTDLSKSY